MRLALLLSLLLAGCTHYEFDIIHPPQLTQHVGTKSDAIATLDPLEYRFRSYEDHLIIRVFNPTDEPIKLLGDQSAVVDPEGQSHPLRSATIESHSFVKLILPPAPIIVEPTGPRIGIGLGVRAEAPTTADQPLYLMTHGRRYHRGYYPRYYGFYGWRAYDPWFYDYYSPRYYVLYDENDTTYWDWRGETEVRLALAFERNGKTFRDEFEFKRVKMK
jgi:hypothetical protein